MTKKKSNKSNTIAKKVTAQDIEEVKVIPVTTALIPKAARPVQPPQMKMPQQRPPTFRPRQIRKSVGR